MAATMGDGNRSHKDDSFARARRYAPRGGLARFGGNALKEHAHNFYFESQMTSQTPKTTATTPKDRSSRR
jgi:hypothetical protein